MQKLKLPTKLAYGIGQAAEGIKNTAFSNYLLFFYTAVLGLPGTLTGLALFAATAFDAVTDPVAGSVSDRWRGRFGRRHPFLYAAALPLGITFALLFSPPAGLGEMQLFAWLLLFAVLVRGSMTLYHVPHLALGAELSDDYRERTTVVAYRTFFSICGAIVLVGAAWGVFFRATPAFPNGQLDPAVYPGFGLWFGGATAFFVLASAAGTHARIPTLPQAAGDLEPFGAAALVREYRGALANASFRAFFVGLVVFFVMRGIQDTLLIHMATYFWALSPREILYTQIGAAPGLLLGVPFWAIVARRTDKRPTFLVGVALFSAIVVLPPVAKLAGFFPPREAFSYLAILVAVSFFASFCAMSGLVTAGSMMADIADEHELATGRRQEGMFFGALSFAVKSTSGLGTFVAGVALDWIAFPRQAEPAAVPPEVVDQLGILYGPGIGLLAVIALAFLRRYRIDRARHAEIASELARRRAAG